MPPMQFSMYNYVLDLIGWLVVGDVHLSLMVAIISKNEFLRILSELTVGTLNVFVHKL
jgi:hypothetical protein